MSQDSKTASQRTPTALLDRHWRAIVAVLAVLPFLTIGVGVWVLRSATDGAITRRSDLQKIPEEHLYYPGSAVIGSIGNDYMSGIWGSNPATSGHRLGVDASQAEVLAFYDRELAARGWQQSTNVIYGTAELEVRGWVKGGVLVRLAILRKNDPRYPAAVNAYQTPYEIVLIAKSP